MEIRQSLAKAAAEGIDRLMDRVHEATEELLALWLSPSHVTIEELLRSYALEIEEAAEGIESAQLSAYELGRFDGTVEIFQKLVQAEKRNRQIIAAEAENSAKVVRILEKLYVAGAAGLRHHALAEAAGIPVSTLTGIMKNLVPAGAVEVSRFGKSTHYVLSAAGRRYWEDRMAQWEGERTQELAEVRRKLDQMSRELDQIKQEHQKQRQKVKITPAWRELAGRQYGANWLDSPKEKILISKFWRKDLGARYHFLQEPEDLGKETAWMRLKSLEHSTRPINEMAHDLAVK